MVHKVESKTKYFISLLDNGDKLSSFKELPDIINTSMIKGIIELFDKFDYDSKEKDIISFISLLVEKYFDFIKDERVVRNHFLITDREEEPNESRVDYFITLLEEKIHRLVQHNVGFVGKYLEMQKHCRLPKKLARLIMFNISKEIIMGIEGLYVMMAQKETVIAYAKFIVEQYKAFLLLEYDQLMKL
jgi:hypothetical protein